MKSNITCTRSEFLNVDFYFLSSSKVYIFNKICIWALCAYKVYLFSSVDFCYSAQLLSIDGGVPYLEWSGFNYALVYFPYFRKNLDFHRSHLNLRTSYVLIVYVNTIVAVLSYRDLISSKHYQNHIISWQLYDVGYDLFNWKWYEGYYIIYNHSYTKRKWRTVYLKSICQATISRTLLLSAVSPNCCGRNLSLR